MAATVKVTVTMPVTVRLADGEAQSDPDQWCHILTVRSLLPDATCEPLGDQSRAYTSSSWPAVGWRWGQEGGWEWT